MIKGFITRSSSHTGIRRGRTFSISSDAYQIVNIIIRKQEPVLKIGNLDTIRVVMDVEDTVRAYYELMLHPDSNKGIFNVCGTTPRKMEYFTDYMIKLSGIDIKKEIYQPYWRPIDINYQDADISELVNLTGWKQEIPIEKTLEDLLNYWIKKIKNDK